MLFVRCFGRGRVDIQVHQIGALKRLQRWIQEQSPWPGARGRQAELGDFVDIADDIGENGGLQKGDRFGQTAEAQQKRLAVLLDGGGAPAQPFICFKLPDWFAGPLLDKKMDESPSIVVESQGVAIGVGDGANARSWFAR